MISDIPWWVFMLVGAAIGGPAGLLIAAKVTAKKYIIMKLVAGAVAGGIMGTAFGLLGGGGGIGTKNGEPLNGEGSYIIKIKSQVKGERVERIELRFEVEGKGGDPTIMKPEDNLSEKLHGFSQHVAETVGGGVVRFNQQDGQNIPHALRDQIVEELRLGGVRLSLE